MSRSIRIATITPAEALRDLSWCIVGKSGVYELYRDRDTATRICADLNRRYGRDEYHVAHVEQPTCHMETVEDCQNWNSCSECDADYYTDQPLNYCPNCGRKVVDQ